MPLAVYNMGYRGSAPLLVRLGKHTAGKSCLYIEKLANIDLKVLSELVVQSIAALRSSLTA